MSELKEPRSVKLFVGIIYGKYALLEECIKKLEERFGESDFISERFPFDSTNYYEKEMGTGLGRKIISFKTLIKREELVSIKIFTNELEKVFSIGGKRRVNIDPGYVAHEHLILATGKAYYHRPYLGGGVYADLTLVYREGEFKPMGWTYPDYRTEGIRNIFKKIRAKYIVDLSKELELI